MLHTRIYRVLQILFSAQYKVYLKKKVTDNSCLSTSIDAAHICLPCVHKTVPSERNEDEQNHQSRSVCVAPGVQLSAVKGANTYITCLDNP